MKTKILSRWKFNKIRMNLKKTNKSEVKESNNKLETVTVKNLQIPMACSAQKYEKNSVVI
jgi:hypothetical protein